MITKITRRALRKLLIDGVKQQYLVKFEGNFSVPPFGFYFDGAPFVHSMFCDVNERIKVPVALIEEIYVIENTVQPYQPHENQSRQQSRSNFKHQGQAAQFTGFRRLPRQHYSQGRRTGNVSFAPFKVQESFYPPGH